MKKLASLAFCAAILLLIPAVASANTYCVNTGGTCTLSYNASQLQLALNAAQATSTDDTVRIGPGTYTGTFTYTGNTDTDTIDGAGRGLTQIALPNSASAGTALTVNGAHAIVQDLDISLTATNSTNDVALENDGGAARRIHVIGNGSDGTTGVILFGGTIADSTIDQAQTTATGDRGVLADGNTFITHSTINAQVSINFAGPGTTLTVSGTTLNAGFRGIESDGGTVDIDDSLINLGAMPNTTGLYASNQNNGTPPITMHARHVTIYGTGTNSVGVRASASAAGAKQQVNVTIDDSIINGLTTPILRAASNGGGLGGSSAANVTTNYSAYNAGAVSSTNGANGSGAVAQTNQIGSAPGFVNTGTANFHLTPASALIDAGNPAAAGPATDLDGNARVMDGNGDFVERRDVGAYELPDTAAPPVQITSGPPATTANPDLTFEFSSADPTATFSCRFDSDPFVPCTTASSNTQTVADGAHTFEVRATDHANNSSTASQAVTVDTSTPPGDTPPGDNPPADTKAPKTTISGSAKVKTTKKHVRVSFTADDPSASFECRLDGGAFAKCSSPYKTPKLKPGKHSVTVRATDVAGNLESSPPTVQIKVKRKPRS